jgi:hypothetical protein
VCHTLKTLASPTTLYSTRSSRRPQYPRGEARSHHKRGLAVQCVACAKPRDAHLEVHRDGDGDLPVPERVRRAYFAVCCRVAAGCPALWWVLRTVAHRVDSVKSVIAPEMRVDMNAQPCYC